jgi:hypothetical protein
VRERAAELAGAGGIAIEHITKSHIRKEDVQAVVDLAGLIGYYSFVSVRLNVFEVPTPPGARLLNETSERPRVQR